MEKVALNQIFLPVFWVFLVSINLPVLHLCCNQNDKRAKSGKLPKKAIMFRKAFDRKYFPFPYFPISER